MKLFFGVVIAVLILGYAHAQSGTICDGVTENTFLRDVSRCDGWFLCTANGPLPGNCSYPYLFNEPQQQCDWEENVECFSCPLAQLIAHFPVPNRCDQFIRCINGVAAQHVCTSPLLFNNETGNCDLAANVPACEIQRTCPTNIPPGQIVSFRDDTNCSNFWICAGTPPTPVADQCNPALHFDLVLNQCTLPHLTDCPAGTPAPDDDPPGNGGGSPPGTTVPPAFTCPAPEGTFPHPTTCSSFFICANNTPHILHCGDNLHFSEAINNCDTIPNANCFRP